MFWLIRRLRHDFATWDRSTRLAFGINLILLIIAVVVALAAPPDARLPILAGMAALVIMLEGVVLWGNRGMVSTFTRAQRLYLQGDFDAARDLIEALRPKADARTLALLGNIYRQVGDLHASEQVLSEAVNKAPNHYFPIYGFGRTLLAEGRYADAVTAIQRALEIGAPSVVRVDLAEAYYRLNQPRETADALRAAGTAEGEPHRALIAAYLLYRLGEAPPPAPELVEAGLPYWQASAERFRETPYGAALALDVRELSKLNLGAKTHD
jgi:predicted Zn-dependent protease